MYKDDDNWDQLQAYIDRHPDPYDPYEPGNRTPPKPAPEPKRKRKPASKKASWVIECTYGPDCIAFIDDGEKHWKQGPRCYEPAKWEVRLIGSSYPWPPYDRFCERHAASLIGVEVRPLGSKGAWKQC